MSSVDIRPLSHTPDTVAALSRILVDVVAGGGSVSFMHPLAPADAAAFWEKALAAADAGERVVLGAFAGDDLAATVTLDLATPPNQPHRADVAKLMTAPAHRNRGYARALMLEAEHRAIVAGRTLLTLDTAAEDGAAGLYESVGFRFVGEIPDYALKPHGGLTGTLIYDKRIGVGVG